MTELTLVERGFALLDGAAEMGRTGLVLKRDLSFTEWTDLGAGLQRVEGGLQWALGDWLAYGEARYGEKYAQAVEAAEATGRNVESLRVAQWVAERIPVVRRRTSLSWSHHQEVAALEPDEQEKLLKAAEDGVWSRKAIREAVRVFKDTLALPAGPTPVRELPVKVTVSASKPEADDMDAFDPVAELEREQKENDGLRAEIERLTSDDKDKEIRKLSAEVSGLTVRINGLLNEKKAAIEKAQYGEKKLKDIRRALGVERDRDILDAITYLQTKIA